jgi:RimJ/RimL family protein N-acetyltransferase
MLLMTWTHAQARAFAQTLLSAIDAADWDGVTNCFTPDAVYTPPAGPACRGRPAIRTYYESVRPIATGVHTLQDVMHSPARIVARGIFNGTTRQGITVAMDFVDTLEVTAGLISNRVALVRDRAGIAIAAPAVLHSERLLLRPFQISDAADIARIAGTREIADTTISVPHPLSLDAAREWIATDLGVPSHERQAFAVTESTTGKVLGLVALKYIEAEHGQAELSFWIDPAHWGKGYAREAAQRLVAHAFGAVGLRRLVAYHMVRNPASGKVLTGIGFTQEGLLRQRVRKWCVLEDVCACALLAPDANPSK